MTPQKVNRFHRIYCGFPPGEGEDGEELSISSLFHIDVGDHTSVDVKIETKLERSPEIVHERISFGTEQLDPSVYSDIRELSFEEVSECLRIFFRDHIRDLRAGKIRGITRDISQTRK